MPTATPMAIWACRGPAAVPWAALPPSWGLKGESTDRGGWDVGLARAAETDGSAVVLLFFEAACRRYKVGLACLCGALVSLGRTAMIFLGVGGLKEN